MKRNSQYPTDTLFKGIRTLLTSLPTEEEKSELIRTLRETSDFLGELQALVEAFPTVESSVNLSQGLSRLDILAARASNDAPLRKLMGFRSSRGSQVKNDNGAEDSKVRVDRLAQRIEASENTDVTSLLEQSGEPMSVLTDLADSLGLRIRSRERKADLIKRVATHVTNQRGYRILRGEAESRVR